MLSLRRCNVTCFHGDTMTKEKELKKWNMHLKLVSQDRECFTSTLSTIGGCSVTKTGFKEMLQLSIMKLTVKSSSQITNLKRECFVNGDVYSSYHPKPKANS